MKNVLILTYYWPPGSGPGVQRWLKFTKYLPEFGWKPTVITVANGSYPSTDETLLKDIPAETEVLRTKTLEPFALYNALRGKQGKSVEVAMGSVKTPTSGLARLANYVRANYFIPDARMGWNTYLVPEAAKVIGRLQPEVIITTGPPHSTHLAGRRLKKKYGMPWLADFRDPWTTIYYNEFLLRTPASKARDQKLEDAVLDEADVILTATPGLENELAGRSNAIQTIPNGFDQEDIPEGFKAVPEKFTLSYIGNYKSNQNIEGLWTAIARFAADDAVKNSFQLRFTGNVHASVMEGLERAGIIDFVEVEPFVPHAEAVQKMFDSHMLLLPVPMGKTNKLILTGKIFEYLATRRPLLAVGPPDGNAATILNECGKAPLLDYNDVDGMVQQLKAAFRKFTDDPAPAITGNEQFMQYSRRGTTGQLADLLNRISSE